MKKIIQAIVGVLVGGFCIWFVFRNTNWGEVWASVRRVNIAWLVMSQVAVWASFFTRVQRWSYIVRAGHPVSFGRMFSATQVFLLGNMVLPARLGELIRPVALSRLTSIPFFKAGAMTALDRVADMVALIVMMLITASVVNPTGDIPLPEGFYVKAIPANLIRTSIISAVALLAAMLAVLVLLYVNKRPVLRASDAVVGLASKRLAEKVREMLEHFAEGLHIFRSGGDLLKCVFFSLITWLCFAAMNACLIFAFGIEAPWYTAIVMTVIVAIVISVPGAPAFTGQFHLGMVATFIMVAPAVALNDAKAAALVGHIAMATPVLIAGVYCIARENLAFGKLAKESVQAETAEQESAQA